MTEINVEISQEAKEVEASIDLVVQETKEFKIVTTADLEVSANLLKKIKQKRKQIDEVRKSLTRPLDQAKKTIMNFFRPAETKLDDAENCIEKAILIFRAEERKRIEEEQKKLAEEAKKRQEEELAKLQQQQEEAEMLGDDETVANLEAQKAVVATSAEVSSIIVADQTETKIAGVSEVKRWKAYVVDKTALIKYIAQTGQLENLIEISSKELNNLAIGTKGTINIPGIEFKQESSLSVRK